VVQISWYGAGKRGDDYEWALVLGGVVRQQLQVVGICEKGFVGYWLVLIGDFGRNKIEGNRKTMTGTADGC
jgi:hypothetical protein